MMTATTTSVFVLACLVLGSFGQLDHCSNFSTCVDCISHNLCGWCSEDVIYKNGQIGKNCAGFNVNGSDTFICNGIYSTDQCVRGWVCNESSWQCVLGPAGGGVPQQQCEANCTPTNKKFICNNNTHQCEVSPNGQGTDYQQCETTCVSPFTHAPTMNPVTTSPTSSSPSSNSPSSPQPSPTPAPTYLCNMTTYQCNPTTPGHGSSLLVCEQSCVKPTPHNITPPALVGVWRAINIAKGFVMEEFDFNITTSTMQVYAGGKTSTCVVQSYSSNQVWFVGCHGTLPITTVKCIYESSQGMPETYHQLLGCNPEGDAPASLSAAFSTGPPLSLSFMSQCVPNGFCSFSFGPQLHGLQASRRFATEERNIVSHIVEHLKPVPHVRVNPFSDPCEEFGANCTYCMSHSYCGWCSTDVVYENGAQGSRCAGFSPDSKIPHNFTCSGTYDTEGCPTGWTCDPLNSTCVLSQPGMGVPQALCEAQCKPIPNPPPQLIGYWRGIQINHHYEFGEFEANITNTNVTLFFQGTIIAWGTTYQLDGNVVFSLTFNQDQEKGPQTFIGLWANAANEFVEYITVALGLPGEIAPPSFNDGMTELEFIMAKCTASTGCTW